MQNIFQPERDLFIFDKWEGILDSFKIDSRMQDEKWKITHYRCYAPKNWDLNQVQDWDKHSDWGRMAGLSHTQQWDVGLKKPTSDPLHSKYKFNYM